MDQVPKKAKSRKQDEIHIKFPVKRKNFADRSPGAAVSGSVQERAREWKPGS